MGGRAQPTAPGRREGCECRQHGRMGGREGGRSRQRRGGAGNARNKRRQAAVGAIERREAAQDEKTPAQSRRSLDRSSGLFRAHSPYAARKMLFSRWGRRMI